MRNVKFVFASIIALTLFSPECFSAKKGNEGSGGGNALVCFDTPTIPKQIRERDAAGEIIDGSIRNEHISHITRIEILDLVEAKFKRGMASPSNTDLVALKADEDTGGYAERIIKRLENVAPELYTKLFKRLRDMPADDAIAQPDGLYPVDDYNLLGRFDSINCVVATVAIHQLVGETSTLYYDQRLMFHTHHSNLSKAVTYLHEIVYSVGRSDFSHTDSQNTRKLVGLLIKNNVSVDELKKTLESSDFLSTSDGSPMLASYKFSQRSDRLGQTYFWLNFEANNFLKDLLNKQSKQVETLVNEYLIPKYAAAVKNMNTEIPSLNCKDFKTCEFEINDILKKPKFRKKEIVEKAQILNSKYFLFFNEARDESRKEAQFTILLAAKKELMKFYEDKYQGKLLSISNIPMQFLKKVDETIEDTIEGHMDKIFIRMQKNIQSEAAFSGSKNWDLFSDSVEESILKDVPVQKTL